MSSPPKPLLAVHEISLYNTGRLSPEKIVAAFAARVEQFKHILADLVAERPKSRAQHHLIVGQRGMGKTMLLARLAAELRTQPDLSAHFIPLTFPEEQYAVDRLSKFWLNCLDSLADAREATHDAEAVEEIDATVKRLLDAGTRAVRDDQPFAVQVYDAFVKAAQATGQRAVLLVDNLQLVFERLELGQQHSLRELLMRPGSPILVGTSPNPPPQTTDYGAVFYDHFKVHYLSPLDESEMRALLLHLADAAQREDVRQRVLQHPARLTILRQLTGGNPRTTLTLFFLYAEDSAPTVFADLEGLLDRVTPLYKARFEELTPQQQVIVSAIANHWDPITATDLALMENTGLPASTISAQLDRLDKAGVVERAELFGESRAGYMLAERFFNIWFLMRSASRRQRREVEFLTHFLESFYEPAVRNRIARKLMEDDHFSPGLYFWSCAVAASLSEREAAEELTRHTELAALSEDARDARTRLNNFIDFESLPPETLAFSDLRERLMSLVPEAADVTPKDFAKAVLGDREMFISGERGRLAAHIGKLNTEEVQTVLEAIRRTRLVDEQHYLPDAVAWFSQRIANGQIRNLHNADDWNRSFHQASDRSAIALMVDSLPAEFGTNLTESTFKTIASHIRPIATAPAWRWFEWGIRLHCKLNQHAEAEIAYRNAVTRDQTLARAWNNLGALLEEHGKQYSEAESAYRKAIAFDQIGAMPWNNLGNLLRSHLKRYKEAETAYLESIARNSKYPPPWHGLGILYHEHLGLPAKAETAYRTAIALDSTDACPWHNLGNLLQDRLGRYSESETAYREAIALDSNFALPWAGLGNLLSFHLHRYTEAESAYKEVLLRDPQNAAAWNGLGNLYCDRFDRLSEAAEAFNNAMRLDPSSDVPYQNLLFLHRDFLGAGSAARAVFEKLCEIPKHTYPDVTNLQKALFASYESNWGIACDALANALTYRKNGFSPNSVDDWLRASAVLVHLNYDAELLAFLDQRGDTVARLRPWVEALRALQKGDRRALQNIAPEIRATAEVFYDGIESQLKKLPEKTRRRPITKPKRTRSNRRSHAKTAL